MNEREILLQLHRDTNGPGWRCQDGWKTDRPLSEWYGVSTGENDRVKTIDLDQNNLQGSIPGCLGELEHLELLDLRNNNLEGPIPPEICRIPALRMLFLQDNQLRGPIPREIDGHPRLVELALDNNQLEGGIPAGLGQCPKLLGLYLSGCGLAGGIPPELAGARKLILLDLAYNSLQGPIPKELEQLVDLTGLYLEGNFLSGRIPPGLWEIDNNDLGELVETMGYPSDAGHITILWGGNAPNLSISTCPEWPARQMTFRVQKGEMLQGLALQQLVEVLHTTPSDGEMWAERITPRWETH